MIERIRRAELELDPNVLWNRFVALLARGDAESLDAVQWPAHLAFWYESEVQNGGHLQFFLNRPDNAPEMTVRALETLGAHSHACILARAVAIWRQSIRTAPASEQELVEMALLGEFDALDAEFYALASDLVQILEAHLRQNRAAYFVIED
ncbi:MAG: DUF4375 domain-containing protein [Bryobacteraceae bacterium]